MSINKTRVKMKDEIVPTHEGGTAYVANNPLINLRIVASSCFFGEPSYYVSNKTPAAKPKATSSYMRSSFLPDFTSDLGALVPYSMFGNGKTTEQMMVEAIDAALNFNLEETLKLACYLRNEALMRVTPQVILVRAANHPKAKATGLIRKYAPFIVKRGDEPSTCVAYQFAAYGKKMPMSLKKALKDILESFDEYVLAKYQMRDREVKTVDVVNLTHAYSPTIDKLVKGTLSLEDKTWEAIISKEGSTKEAWTKAVEVMPHMALLRNLRNFITKGVDGSVWGPKLVATAKNGKQMPFRYWTAYKEVQNIASGSELDFIEQAMEVSIGEMPTFTGRTLILTDISGSMTDGMTSDLGSTRIYEIANLTALLIHRSSENGSIVLFDTSLKPYEARKKTSIFTEMEKMRHSIGGGTGNPICMSLETSSEHWDNVFVLSDMQVSDVFTGGRSAPATIKNYRKRVNPNVNIHFIQLGGYQSILVPQYYNRTYMLGGWNSNVIRFAHEMASITG